jgi:hypothetical protein
MLLAYIRFYDFGAELWPKYSGYPAEFMDLGTGATFNLDVQQHGSDTSPSTQTAA